MRKLTFRVDDVSANTNDIDLLDIVSYLNSNFDCNIWLCVSLFSKQSNEGSVYPNPPFKSMEPDRFYWVNQFRAIKSYYGTKLVSHGLFHTDHSTLSRDAQEMSIIGSCSFIDTMIFVPPFNRYNRTTQRVCSDFGIQLVKSNEEGWKSLEHNDFNPSHSLWYFHPWRYSFCSFKEKINKSVALSRIR